MYLSLHKNIAYVNLIWCWFNNETWKNFHKPIYMFHLKISDGRSCLYAYQSVQHDLLVSIYHVSVITDEH